MSVAFLLLAIRANSEELEFVDYGFEAAVQGNAIVEVGHGTVFDLNHARTAQTNEMMVMAVITFREQFEPRDTVAKIKPLDHGHAFQQMDRTINRRQITVSLWQRRKNFFDGEWMRVSSQDIQNRLPGPGHLA